MTTHRLIGSGTFKDLEGGIKALTFGLLVQQAFPAMEHYQSDLYHDARWINDYVKGEMTWYFGWDKWGTAIGTDCELVAYSRKNMAQVQLRCEWDRTIYPERPSGTWYLEIDVLKSLEGQ